MAMLPGPGSIPISQLIGDDVARAPADATLQDVTQALTRHAVGALVIGEDERPIAVFSERDLVRAVAAGRDLATTLARDVASTELVWCDVDSTVDDVAVEMLSRYIRHVLVEENGTLVGVVSARDLLGAYTSGIPLD
jgi:CBS domain-containing protein